LRRSEWEFANEGFLLEIVDPLLLQPGALFGQQDLFDFIADFRKAFYVGGVFVLHEHDVEGAWSLNDTAAFARLKGERGVSQFFAQHGFFDPSPIATLSLLRTLRIKRRHFGKRRAIL